MSFNRKVLREQAKKLYKQQVRGIKKNQRIPFSVFFERFMKGQVARQTPTEDFNFDDMVNINNLEEVDEQTESVEKQTDRQTE